MQRSESYWSWGRADRLPDRAARAALSAQLGALVGIPGLEPRDPLPVEQLSLPIPRIRLPDALSAIVSQAPYDRARNARGRSFVDQVRGLTGDFGTAPDVVARPRDEQEVSAVLDAAAELGAAVVPFGGGSSVVGGVECRGDGYAGVVSLDLGALDRVLEVDPVSRAARIQGGIRGPALEAALAPHGLTLRHYPQSFEHSTLGGWIATRAGGHFATLYTHIDDLVESIRMITPRGEWQSRRLPASGAGPSPDRLVLGSEGSLGVITEAWMRLQARPRWRSSASVHFSRFADAVAATREIAQAGLYPANCRLLDTREAKLHGVSFDGSSVLLLGFEAAHHPVGAWLDLALDIARAHAGRLPEAPAHRDDGERIGEASAGNRWRQAFFDGPYLQSALLTCGVVVDTFETACTWDRFDALHEDVVRSVRLAAREVCGQALVSCRFTHVYPDGPAPYYTFLCPPPVREGDVAAAQIAAWREIKAAASEALARNGATITHHHAVGRAHRPWYDRQRPDRFADALRAAKRAVDPSGIMNPGVLIDP